MSPHPPRTLRRDRAGKGRDPDSEAGFTLVELLVVLVILSLVMGLVGPRVLSYLSDARAKAAQLQIGSLAAALDLYYLDVGRFPSEREGLDGLVSGVDIPSWNGPYIQQSAVPLDPWGHQYAYRAPDPARAYTIVSFGADGVEGGSDEASDITNR